MTKPRILLNVDRLTKSFRLHQQGGIALPVLAEISFAAQAGECVVIAGPSGVGKSTLLRCIYGNYRADGGSIVVDDDGDRVELIGAAPRRVLALRRRTIGYVSQFLRVIPRVPTLDVVAEPLRNLGVPVAAAQARAAELLTALAIPERLWPLPPATFSGGERQRVNLARGFAHPYPLLLLDEPTSALDAANRARVVALIEAAKRRGAAVIGIFHDPDMAEAVGSRAIELTRLKDAA